MGLGPIPLSLAKAWVEARRPRSVRAQGNDPGAGANAGPIRRRARRDV